MEAEGLGGTLNDWVSVATCGNVSVDSVPVRDYAVKGLELVSRSMGSGSEGC